MAAKSLNLGVTNNMTTVVLSLLTPMTTKFRLLSERVVVDGHG